MDTMDPTMQLPTHFNSSPVKATAKAKEVFARCVEEIKKWPAPVHHNPVATQLDSIAAVRNGTESSSPYRLLP